MTGFQGYDQWKTASPYDDEPDFIEEAEKYLKNTSEGKDEATDNIRGIMQGLLEYLEQS